MAAAVGTTPNTSPQGSTLLHGPSPSRTLLDFAAEISAGIAGRVRTRVYHMINKLRICDIMPSEEEVSVIGVVIDGGEVGIASGGFNLTINLVDPSVANGTAAQWNTGDWIGLTFLHKDPDMLPAFKRGDVLLVRDVLIRPYGRHYRLNMFENRNWEWSHLPLSVFEWMEPSKNYELLSVDNFSTQSGGSPPVLEERIYMQRLLLWSRDQIKNSRRMDLASIPMLNEGCIPFFQVP